MTTRTLGSHIVLRLATVTTALLVGCVMLYGVSRARVAGRVETEEAAQLEKLLGLRLEKKRDIAITNAISVAGSSRLAALLAARDRTGARAEIARLGEIFRSRSNFKGIKIQLLTPDGRTFLRSWKPDAHGDIAAEAARVLGKDGKSAAQFVLDTDGVLLRGATPLVHEDQVVGQLQFIQGVGSVSRDFEREGRAYMMLVAPDVAARSPQLKKNRSIQGFFSSNDKWFSEDTVRLISQLDLPSLQKRGAALTHDSFAVAIPLIGLEGETVGLSVVSEPASVLRAQIEDSTRASLSIMVVMAFGLVSLSVLAYRTVKACSVVPLASLADFADDVAHGRWDSQPKGRFRFELEVLANALVSMVETLRAKRDEAEANERVALEKAEEAQANSARLAEALQTVREAVAISSNTRQAALQVAASAETIEHAVDTQRNQIAETARAMAEMDTVIASVSQTASESAKEAEQARAKAEHGQDLVSQMVNAIQRVTETVESLETEMGSLGGQVESICEVIATITDIADQTNMLALNASIEAANAGDAGHGFAVVAAEVRGLAERTMQATLQVESAIARIQAGARHNVEESAKATQTVRETNKVAQESGIMLHEIVDISRSTAHRVMSMATSAAQQTSVVRQVVDATHALHDSSDRAAQVTAELVDTSSQLQAFSAKIDAVIDRMERT